GFARGRAAGVGELRVRVLHEGVVVAREAVPDGGADQRAVVGVRVPRAGDPAAVPGGEEVVGAALGDVEAERAAVLPAVDGISGREHRAELPTRVTDHEVRVSM